MFPRPLQDGAEGILLDHIEKEGFLLGIEILGHKWFCKRLGKVSDKKKVKILTCKMPKATTKKNTEEGKRDKWSHRQRLVMARIYRVSDFCDFM